MTIWKRAAAVLALLAGAAGAQAPPGISPKLQRAMQDVFGRVSRLRVMDRSEFYGVSVGGKFMMGTPDKLARRRTGQEILDSGISNGAADGALAAAYLFEQQGYETRFIDAVKISTQALEGNFSGLTCIAVRDTVAGVWVLFESSPFLAYSPFDFGDQVLNGNYWIGFRGRLAEYPVHDPEALKSFYRDTFRAIPPEALNYHLFRFQFTVDPSLGADGKYRNPHLGAFLADNGKILAAHGVHPVREIPIRLVAGGKDASVRLDRSGRDGWSCRLGLDNPCGPGLTGYFEDAASGGMARQPPNVTFVNLSSSPIEPAPARSATSRQIEPRRPSGQPAGTGMLLLPVWLPFAACGILCAGLLVFWQRHRLAGHETAIAYWACQVLGWGVFLVWAAANQVQQGAPLATGAAMFLSGILLTDQFRRQIRRRGWLSLPRKPMLGRLAIAVAALATAHAILIFAAAQAAYAWARSSASESAILDWLGTVVIWAAWTTLYVLLTAPRRHRETETRLQLALRDAELRALEAQINPHFLFNCLNSIRGLVVENAAMAQDMLTRLANILRYNLRRDMAHTVTLASEVEIVGDYLALEHARFEDRLRVHISIDPDAGGAQVPPMLLQTLVENAIKHGIAPLTTGGDLLIRAVVVGDSVMMEVENPGQIAESAPEATQMGLANIRERLRIVYNGRASLELKNRNGRVAATVVIPRTV